MMQNSSKLKIPWKLLLFRLFVGAVLILVGLSVYVGCVWDLAFVGPGDASQTLVARGTYKFVRNPMYLGLVVILLGEGLLFGSWRLLGYAAVFWAVVYLLVILYEERTLAK